MASSQKNILILGASFAGISATHYFLKHVLPALPEAGKEYHVTLINPSPVWFTRPAAVRSIISEDLMPHSKTFLPIADGFKNYPSTSFTFLEATAIAMSTSERTITVAARTGEEQTLPYHALILATGTQTISPILGIKTNTDDLRTAIDSFRSQLPTATTIVIAGGGPAGVESAGEIGEYLNGKAGWFASRPAHAKAKITVVTGGAKLLPALRDSLAKKAETYLNKVGVDVVYNTRVERTEPAEAGQNVGSVIDKSGGKTMVFLSTGETLEADIYIPATGVLPNTSFVPKELLTEKGYVETNASTLRVDAAGARVYAIGDVGSYTRGGVLDIYDAVPVLLTNVKRDLMWDAKQSQPHEASSEVNEKAAPSSPTGQDRPYKANLKETQLVPVGRSKGVGAVFGWKLPSFMVWAIKGRDYFVAQAPPVQLGTKWNKESKWKMDM